MKVLGEIDKKPKTATGNIDAAKITYAPTPADPSPEKRETGGHRLGRNRSSEGSSS